MNTQQAKKGFTIIEVVLVLAIAGLIFLMIFIAWPALQRGQRDTARKADANVVVSAIGSLRSNSRGASTVTAANLKGYISSLSQYDISGNNNPITVSAATTGTTSTTPTVASDKIVVVTSAKCNPNDATSYVGGAPRSAAVFVLLEGGGGTGVNFCQDA